MQNQKKPWPWRSTLLLVVLGAVLGYLALRRNHHTGWSLMSDVCFAQATLFLLVGLMEQLGNMHMFTSFTFAFQQVHKLLRGRQDRAEDMKENFLQYRASRPHHDWVGFHLVVGLGWLALAVVFSFLA